MINNQEEFKKLDSDIDFAQKKIKLSRYKNNVGLAFILFILASIFTYYRFKVEEGVQCYAQTSENKLPT